MICVGGHDGDSLRDRGWNKEDEEEVEEGNGKPV